MTIFEKIESEEQHNNTLTVEQKLAERSNEGIQLALKNRNTSKLLLMQEIKGIEELIKIAKSNLLTSQVVAGVKDVKMQLKKCKESHLTYVSNLSAERAEIQYTWVEVYLLYEMLNNKVYNYLEKVTANGQREKKDLGLRMEPLKMPSFDGDIRKHSKFKSNFKRQIEVQVKSNETLSYILKSCLCGEALIATENMDNLRLSLI